MPMVSLNYLATHARNYEALLQTYRQINLTTQSVFLILGTFLLSQVITARTLYSALLLQGLLVSITVFSNVVMLKLNRVIRQRGEDVNWWYRKMIRLEQELPYEDRVFTQFKVHQSRGFLNDERLAKIPVDSSPLGDEDIRALLDADLDQIRRVINTYILQGITLIWIVILLISVGSVFVMAGR